MTTSKARAFTLIELLVVIGLIALLAGGIGLAMRDGSPSSTLRASQNTLVGLLSAARGQAALTQADAMLIINASPGESAMRELQVVVRVGTNTWRPVGTPVTLPKGVYIIPPKAMGGVQFASGWPADLKSAGFITSEPPVSAADDPEEVTSSDTTYDPFEDQVYLKFQLFSPLGTTTGSGTLLVGVGNSSGPGAVTLDKPEAVRGVKVSRYGVPIIINEAETLD